MTSSYAQEVAQTDDRSVRSPMAVPSSLVPAGDLYLPTADDGAFEFALGAASPFADAMAPTGEAELEAQMFEELVAELDDEEFEESLEAIVNEGSARHMAAVSNWHPSPEAAAMAQTELEQWMESLAAATDDTIASLEAEHADQSLEWFSEDEFDFEYGDTTNPLSSQELFFKSLRRKFRKVVKAVKRGVKKGLKFVGKLNPLNRIIAALRKAVRPLLQKLLQRILGKLPRSIRPIAKKLARRLGVPIGNEVEALDELSDGEFFDLELMEHLLGPGDNDVNGFENEAMVGDDSAATDDLDDARDRLVGQLLEMPEGTNPIQEMEQFIPAVMAALPLIRLGIKVVGRKRVVNTVANVLAPLVSKLVGRKAGRTLSRHLADKGLRLLRLEAGEEGDTDRLGAEALVAAAEDTIRDVSMLDPETFDDPALLEAEVQEAFTAAAVRHLPAELLRSDLRQGSEDESGVWLMMPRGAKTRRYKRYTRSIPVRISRPRARSIVFSSGETLEHRLEDSGVDSWPVAAELELYELLPGGSVGHIIGSEHEGGAADEFDELSEEVATVLAGDAELALTRGSVSGRGAKRRVFRLKVNGRAVRRRSRFSVRFSQQGSRPSLALHIRLSEREAHQLSTLLERRQTVQVLATIKRLTGRGFERALAMRLARMLPRRKIVVSAAQAAALADAMAAAVVRSTAKQLPQVLPQLSAAAKDPKSGVTLTVMVGFATKDAVANAQIESVKVSVRPGAHHG